MRPVSYVLMAAPFLRHSQSVNPAANTVLHLGCALSSTSVRRYITQMCEGLRSACEPEEALGLIFRPA